MKRIAILTAALGAGISNLMANAGHGIVTVERDRPVLIKQRRISASPRAKNRSRYMPHQGAKERERAARSYMVSAFIGGAPRSAPIMCQMSKSDYYQSF
jgi:hypothetical protein